MTPNELIKLLKEYDFKKNSVRSFSLKYKITEKTILKYLKEHKIPYNNRKINYEMTRNCLGQYTFKNDEDINRFSQNQSQPKSDIKEKNRANSTRQSSSQCVNCSHQNKKSTVSVKNFSEFNQKYEKFFHGSS